MLDAPRATCFRCFRPEVTCLCADVVRVGNRTPLIILQHPRERFHPIGTARIAELALERVQVHVPRGGPSRDVAVHADVPAGAAVLYPSRDAPTLESLSPSERPRALVILDGTWHHAHAIHRDNAWVQALPHVRLAPSAPSRYRLRREPAAHCVSTIEAICAALRVLEPETPGIDALLETFDRMIDRQIAIGLARAPISSRRVPRPRPMPAWCGAEFGRLVVAQTDRTGPGTTLVQVALTRAEGLEVFDGLARVSVETPDPNGVRKTGWRAEDVASASSPESLRAAVRAFLRPRDVLGAWNQATLDVLARLVEPETPRVSLRALWSDLAQSRVGELLEVVREAGLVPPPATARGRAGARLAAAVAVAHALHARAVR